MSRKRMSDKSLVSIIDEDELHDDDTTGDDLFSEPETITTDSIDVIIGKSGSVAADEIYMQSSDDMDSEDDQSIAVPRGVSLDDPVRMYLREIGRIKLLTADEESNINFYDKMFSAIAENGWVADSQVEDNSYLNNMLQNNQYYITTMSNQTDSECEEYYEYNTDIASNFENIFSVNDTDAQNEALVEYEYEKSVINEKESRIDTRMQNLETEQSAINEMIKGIETVKNDNTERTFGIFA